MILFSERDLARMPDGFIEKLNGTLERGSVALGTQPADIEYGFIIRYAGILSRIAVLKAFLKRKKMCWRTASTGALRMGWTHERSGIRLCGGVY